jgi:electron transfer flavoprotein beta subunit
VLDPAGIVAHSRLRRLFINREKYDINPADRTALESALRIKEATGAEVVVVSGRPEPDDDTLRRGLAMGADRAIYLSGDRFEEADDAVIVRALEILVRRLGGAELVLVGETLLDTGQAQLGPRLAEALGWSQILGAWSVKVGSERVQGVRSDRGEPMLVRTELPTVITVVSGALKPRYANGARLINVYRGEGEIADAMEHWDVTDLLTSEELTPIVQSIGRDFPPERERGERAEGTTEETARSVVEALRTRTGR